jgi:hypothetical protein
MEQYRISKGRTLIVLLISLLLHFALVMLILWQSIAQWHQQSIMMQHEIDDETYIAQQLLSSGQQQPATVLFQDEAPSGSETTQTDEIIEEQESEHIEQLFEEKTKTPAELQPDLQAEATTQTTIIPEPAPTQMNAEKPQEIQKPRTKKKKIKHKRTNNKQPITMADVSRGFIKSFQQEAGHNNASRDMKQLSLQVYTTKVWNLIKTAFLAGDSNLHLPEAVSTHTQLTLTIDRSGKLINIGLDYPKHITALRNIERLLITRAQQAGLFPPLPANVKGASKTFSFPLFIQGQPGFHSYSLGYR